MDITADWISVETGGIKRDGKSDPLVKLSKRFDLLSPIFSCVQSRRSYPKSLVNSELMKQALIKVGNPNVLVNIISRRVRQLTAVGGNSRPLISDTNGMGAADIALTEIVEGKMSWELTGLDEDAKPEEKPVPKP